MVQCVVFDFDGTLVDSNAIKRETFYDVVEGIANGASILDEIFSQKLNIDRYQTFKLFAEMASESDDCKNLAERYTQLCDERVIKCSEIEGVSGVLKELHAEGKRLFVNSATPTDSLNNIIVQRHLDCFFETSYGTPLDKLANLIAIAERTQLPAHSIVFVGDGIDDQTAAAAAGCYFIGVGTGTLRGASPAPNILESFTDLPMAIRQLAKQPT